MTILNSNPNSALVNSAYTSVQVMMALDIWTAARKMLDDALDAVLGDFPSVLERSSDQIVISQAVSYLTECCDEVCPLNLHRTNIRRHSSERYPVDKTLRSATHLRTVAAKVAALKAVQS